MAQLFFEQIKADRLIHVYGVGGHSYVGILQDVASVPRFAGERSELRIDLHPAWDCQYQRVAINGLHHGSRKVAVVDLAELLRYPGT